MESLNENVCEEEKEEGRTVERVRERERKEGTGIDAMGKEWRKDGITEGKKTDRRGRKDSCKREREKETKKADSG